MTVAGPIRVEACVDSVASAVAAERGGADRVELCDDLVEGGTTPSVGMMATVRERVRIPVFVLVRPRGGDFVYDADERAVMLRDIAVAKHTGADGVVIGALTVDGRVDRDTTRALMAVARPMAVTFHRAFDLAHDLDEALDDLAALGVDRVLTSGGAATAIDGAATLARLVGRAPGALTILAGGRVDEGNARELVARTGVRELHTRCAAPAASPMRFRRDGVSMGKAYTPDEYVRSITDEARIRTLVDAVRR